jgi:acetyltransferase-like isoleucine patch superfamily enzyme
MIGGILVSRVTSVMYIIYNGIMFGGLKLSGKRIHVGKKCTSRIGNKVEISPKGVLKIGFHFSALKNCRFLVRDEGELCIGDNVGLNTNCIIACHQRIEIGDDVMIGPNVCIYDHDHDFREPEGIVARKYYCKPVKIGNRTWIGANVVILKGAEIGKDCVIAAGSIVNGKIPDNSILIQKRESNIKEIIKINVN